MSDDQTANATPESGAPASHQPAPSGGNTRTLILLGILAIAVSALLYDYMVARPASEAGHDLVLEEASNRSGSDQEQLTNLEVAKLLGKSPVEELKGEHYYVERYAWMGGLPWRSYDCWVVYTPANDGTNSSYRFNSAYLNEEPEEQFMPGYKSPVGPPDPNLPPDPAGAGGGGGGRRQPPGGGADGGLSNGPPGGGADGGLSNAQGGDDTSGDDAKKDDDAEAKKDDGAEAKKDDGAEAKKDDGAEAKKDDGAEAKKDDGAEAKKDDAAKEGDGAAKEKEAEAKKDDSE